jgi:hypothetical protein
MAEANSINSSVDPYIFHQYSDSRGCFCLIMTGSDYCSVAWGEQAAIVGLGGNRSVPSLTTILYIIFTIVKCMD